jgi:hypothetical protein
MSKHEIEKYGESYYSMVWFGAEGYPKQVNSGRCYMTGMLGMLRYYGEPDVLLADGTGGDGFSFRWCPTWGAPAFNGGKGAFHELWEYTPQALGFKSHWEEDQEGGWDEAFETLRSLIDRDIPVQVATHYSLIRPYGDATSPALALRGQRPGAKYASGHHIVIAGYDLDAKTVTIYEPNDILPHSRYKCPIDVFRKAWEGAAQRVDNRYQEWPYHHGWDKAWSLHDGYGPYAMMWVEPGRDPSWDIGVSIRHSYRRNLKILRGDYPKPYALFGNQWMIPHWETGAPGMAVCAEAVRTGKLKDVQTPDGEVRKLFAQAQIPNHGVMGRASAAGYLKRAATELAKRNLSNEAVRAASDLMQQSSDLFRELRYEEDIVKAGDLLSRIADIELKALAQMERGWEIVQQLPKEAAARRLGKVA